MKIEQAVLPLALAMALASSGSVKAGQSAAAPKPDDTVFVIAKYRTQAQLRQVSGQFQHLGLDPDARTIKVEVDAEQMKVLQRAGLEVTIDRDSTSRMQRLRAALARSGGLGMRSIPGFECYRTVEETYQTIDQLVASKPQLASVSNIGPSWEKSRDASKGWDMKVLKLTNAATDAAIPDKPPMVLLGSIHAREYTPAELVTRFAESLVNGHGTEDEATWLLDNFVIYLVLQANPDGRKMAERGYSWRKNTNSTNGCTQYGIGTDLNRNFPFHWNSTGGGGSSGTCSSDVYRGPRAASEPETENIIKLVAGTRNASGVYTGGLLRDRRPDDATTAAPDDYQGIFFDMHSYSELVLWPWGDTAKLSPNDVPMRTLGRRMAHFNNHKPQASIELYPTDGTTIDTFYGVLGAPSYTIELGVAFFEQCSTFTGTTLPRNLAALRYAARNLYAPYKLPSGPDTTTIGISSRTVPAGTPVTVTATVSDAGFNQSKGTEPVQNITSAKAYLDAPPWASGAVGVDMTAADGSFNTPTEQVKVVVPTTGLRAGKHVVYVQGTDASGKPGTPAAVYFTVEGDADNKPPVADFSATVKGLEASFTDASRDPDGRIASHKWEFGDGKTSTEASPRHTYEKAGTYPVTLTVTDDGGLTARKTQSVNVDGSSGDQLKDGVPVTALADAAGSERFWTMEVPAGAGAPQFAISGGTGDADLYVKFGSRPSRSSYDCRPYKVGNNETCQLEARAGTYHVMLAGYTAYSGVSLVGSTGGGKDEYVNDNDIPLVDNGTVESPIDVPRDGNGRATSRVTVDIRHTYIGDLIVELVAPGGTAYRLHNRTGGSADDLRASYTVDLSSEPSKGTWKLRVRDAARGDSGFIDKWSIAF